MKVIQAVEILKKYNNGNETITEIEFSLAIEKVISFVENLKKPAKLREKII